MLHEDSSQIADFERDIIECDAAVKWVQSVLELRGRVIATTPEHYEFFKQFVEPFVDVRLSIRIH